MSFFNIFNSAHNFETRDDNGHPYRTSDGGWIPNNEYELDGHQYKTDDNGSIYWADGTTFDD